MKKYPSQLKNATLLLFISISIASFCNQPEKAAVKNEMFAQIRLQLVTNQIQSPVALGAPADGTNRIFICQKEGKVWIIENGKIVSQPFLDVSNQMVSINPGYDERGLLGIAFHPDFKTNHKFYVYYS